MSWNCGPSMSPSGNTRPRHVRAVISPCGNTRRREHDANPNLRFPASGPFCLLRGKMQGFALPSSKQWSNADGANPSVVSLGIWVCNVPFWEHTSPWLFGPVVSPCGNARPQEHDVSPNPRFLASGLPYSLAEARNKLPYCTRKISQH